MSPAPAWSSRAPMDRNSDGVPATTSTQRPDAAPSAAIADDHPRGVKARPALDEHRPARGNGVESRELRVVKIPDAALRERIPVAGGEGRDGHREPANGVVIAGDGRNDVGLPQLKPQVVEVVNESLLWVVKGTKEQPLAHLQVGPDRLAQARGPRSTAGAGRRTSRPRALAPGPPQRRPVLGRARARAKQTRD